MITQKKSKSTGLKWAVWLFWLLHNITLYMDCVFCFRRGLNPPHRVKSISMTSFTPEEMEFLKSRGNDVSSVHLKQVKLITAIMHFFSNIKNKRVKTVFQLRLRRLLCFLTIENLLPKIICTMLLQQDFLTMLCLSLSAKTLWNCFYRPQTKLREGR